MSGGGGDASGGAMGSGDVSDGAMSGGNVSDGAVSGGAVSGGDASDDAMSGGNMSDGAMSSGNVSDGPVDGGRPGAGQVELGVAGRGAPGRGAGDRGATDAEASDPDALTRPQVLRDVLPGGARVLFCGTAAGTVSARLGAPYAGPGNAFWPTLHAVGLLPAPLPPLAFEDAARWGVALTDLDKHGSGSDAEIGTGGFDPAAVERKVRTCGARVVAFTSKAAGATALGRPVTYGPQPERVGGAEAWVLPSPSGRARRFWDVDPWHALAARIDALAPVVLCAPDKLRGAVDAAGAADALARGVARAGGWPLRLPVADGGEGTLDAFLAGGHATAVTVRVRDAHGTAVDARIGVVGGADAVATGERVGVGRAVGTATAERIGAVGGADAATGADGAAAGADGAAAGADGAAAGADGAAAGADGALTNADGAATDADGATADTDGAVTDANGATAETDGAAAGATVLVEAAEAIALGRVPEDRRDVGRASSAGVGDLVRAALDRGARRVLVAVGGTASIDGGAGFLRALGADAPADGAGLLADPRGSLSGLDSRLAGVDLELLYDVDAPLCGSDGAARRFGPQKGASPDEVDAYDTALAAWAAALGVDPDLPGSGAAGGLGLALRAAGATARPGAEAVLDLVGFDPLAAHAALVLTAEGSVDTSTLQGKTVDAVVRRASTLGTSTIVLGGRVEDDAAAALRDRGASDVRPLGPAHRPLETALAAAAGELEDGAAAAVARLIGPPRA